MKNNWFKKALAFVVAFTMVLGMAVTEFNVKAETKDPVQITIFHTNDMHGRLLDAYTTATSGILKQIGSDYVASIKKSVPNSLLIDAGDSTQGLPFSTLSKGADIIKLMNAAGYDGMTLGNHEFDYGKAQALSNAALANFPVVSANVMENGKPLLDGINGGNGTDFIKTVNGVKIGFFGITTQETEYKTNPANIQGVLFKDPIETSKQEVSKLKAQGAQIIVGIMHIGNDSSSDPISSDIAEKVNGIDVIIDGHSHTVENTVVNNTLIAQTSCYSANIGRIDITVNTDGTISKAESLISAADASKYTPDPVVKSLADKINASQQPFYNTIVGCTNTTFLGGTVNNQSVGRLMETNLGDLVADSMADSAKSQIKGSEFESLPIVALENGGGVRDIITAGYISKGQVIAVLPFGNILSLKEVTPSILYQVLENGVSKITFSPSTGIIGGPDGRFPQIAGMRFEYDVEAAPNSRVTKLVLLNEDGTDKQVLKKDDTTTRIVLASNDFEVAGGDGYTMLGSLKNIGEGNALDVIFADYVGKLTQKADGAFSYPSYQGRIKAVSSYKYAPFTAKITIQKDAKPVPNAEVTYSIDLGNFVKGMTDENGVLKIENVPSGPHNISIYYDKATTDAYINDLIGAGPGGINASLVSGDLAEARRVAIGIDSLPSSITLKDKDSVLAVAADYNTLTKEQKTLVFNYSKLVNAQAAIEKLSTQPAQPENNLPQTGSEIDMNVLITLGILLIISGALYRRKGKVRE